MVLIVFFTTGSSGTNYDLRPHFFFQETCQTTSVNCHLTDLFGVHPSDTVWDREMLAELVLVQLKTRFDEPYGIGGRTRTKTWRIKKPWIFGQLQHQTMLDCSALFGKKKMSKPCKCNNVRYQNPAKQSFCYEGPSNDFPLVKFQAVFQQQELNIRGLTWPYKRTLEFWQRRQPSAEAGGSDNHRQSSSYRRYMDADAWHDVDLNKTEIKPLHFEARGRFLWAYDWWNWVWNISRTGFDPIIRDQCMGVF